MPGPGPAPHPKTGQPSGSFSARQQGRDSSEALPSPREARGQGSCSTHLARRGAAGSRRPRSGRPHPAPVTGLEATYPGARAPPRGTDRDSRARGPNTRAVAQRQPQKGPQPMDAQLRERPNSLCSSRPQGVEDGEKRRNGGRFPPFQRQLLNPRLGRPHQIRESPGVHGLAMHRYQAEVKTWGNPSGYKSLRPAAHVLCENIDSHEPPCSPSAPPPPASSSRGPPGPPRCVRIGRPVCMKEPRVHCSSVGLPPRARARPRRQPSSKAGAELGRASLAWASRARSDVAFTQAFPME